MTKTVNIFDKIISYCIYGIVALTPVFFLPFTADMVEFNKQFLLYFLVLVAVVAWILRCIFEKKLVIRRTALDLPILLLMVVFLTSSILSKSRLLSFWGDFNLLSGSFISFFFYFLFFYLLINNVHSLKNVRNLLLVLFSSATASALFFIIQASGLLPWKTSLIPAWTAASDLPSHLGYFLTVVLVIALSFAMRKKTKFLAWSNILALVAALSCIICIVMIGFKTVWLIAAIAIFFLLVFSISRIEEVRVPVVSAGFAILVLSIIFILLGTPEFLTAKLPTEVALSPAVSWKIATTALSDDLKTFLFGFGPSTFSYAFSAYRPEIFNANFAWSLRFSKPYNTALDILATSGLLGVIAVVAFILVALGMLFVTWLVYGLRIKKKTIGHISDFMHLGKEEGDIVSHTVFSGLITAWLTLLISMFLISFTTIHWVFFFLFLALAFLVGTDFSRQHGQTFELSLKTLPQYTLIASFVYILVFALIFVMGIFLSRFYAAEIYRGKAAQYTAVGNHTKAAADMFKAVSLNPNYARYYLDLASAYVGMAIVESQKDAPDQQTIANLVASAVNQAREAARLAPNDVAVWDFLATMYATARPLSSNANSFVIASLEKAITLEKTNPRLYLQLGTADVVGKDFKGARDAMEKAVALKTNYVLGYQTLSQLDELESKDNEAIEHMSVAAALSPSDPVLLYNLGRLYYNRAKSDDLLRAEQLFILALSVNSNYADALWSLGVLYERQGKTTAALQLYKQVEALNPGNADVEKKIQRLLGD